MSGWFQLESVEFLNGFSYELVFGSGIHTDVFRTKLEALNGLRIFNNKRRVGLKAAVLGDFFRSDDVERLKWRLAGRCILVLANYDVRCQNFHRGLLAAHCDDLNGRIRERAHIFV